MGDLSVVQFRPTGQSVIRQGTKSVSVQERSRSRRQRLLDAALTDLGSADAAGTLGLTQTEIDLVNLLIG